LIAYYGIETEIVSNLSLASSFFGLVSLEQTNKDNQLSVHYYSSLLGSNHFLFLIGIDQSINMDETDTQQGVVDENPETQIVDDSKAEDKPDRRRNCCCITTCVLCLLLMAATGVLVWYFVFFIEESPDPVASCGDCHCIVGSATSGSESEAATCPSTVPRTNFTAEEINVWGSQIALNTYQLDCNPYTDENCDTDPPLLEQEDWGDDAVCALHFETAEDDGANNANNNETKSCKFAPYKLQTYASSEAAEIAGGFVTHVGACGVCSTMQDLAAYVKSSDLTTQAKVCAKQAAFSFDHGRDCYMEELGLTESCAKLWSFNAWNTATDCISSCVLNGGFTDVPNNGPPPECVLNACLQCDEEKSGPIFKQFGGRTRRRAGLLSAIARPCSQVVLLEQDACPATMPLNDEET
jgi:hypothetical protein